MADHVSFIELSASGLAGAVLTQALTGLFAYHGDKRKENSALKMTYRNKQIEIAENFYFVTGETMTMVRKNIEYWQNRSKPRSEASISFFKGEMKKLDDYLENLKATSWKHNLTGLYFNIHLSYGKLIAANSRCHAMHLRLTDLAEQIRECGDPQEKNKWLGVYFTLVFDLCAEYEAIYNLLEKDMHNVKNELAHIFQIS
jgi:hypothetical protein